MLNYKICKFVFALCAAVATLGATASAQNSDAKEALASSLEIHEISGSGNGGSALESTYDNGVFWCIGRSQSITGRCCQRAVDAHTDCITQDRDASEIFEDCYRLAERTYFDCVNTVPTRPQLPGGYD